MMTHVKILAWFNIVLGALGLIAGAAILGGAMVVTDLFLFAVEEAGIPAAVVHVAALVITTIVLVLSLPCLILGYGLVNLRPWARILGIVLAALNLLNVPFGTAVSIYAFWVLFKSETEALFRNAPAPV